MADLPVLRSIRRVGAVLDLSGGPLLTAGGRVLTRLELAVAGGQAFERACGVLLGFEALLPPGTATHPAADTETRLLQRPAV